MAAAATGSITATPAKGAVIFLHGSGDEGSNIQYALNVTGFTQQLRRLGLSVHTPTAKARPYSFAGGALSNVWFDRVDLDPGAPEDSRGMDASFAAVKGLMDQLEAEHGIPSSRVFLGGFSMGGGMALACLSRQKTPLAGMFALGSFLATDSAVYKTATRPLPRLLLCHGQADGVVPYEWGLATAQRLHALSLADTEEEADKVAFYGFPRLQHEFDHRVLSVLGRWIESEASTFPDVAEAQADGKVVRVSLGDGRQTTKKNTKAGTCDDIQVALEKSVDGKHQVRFQLPPGKASLFLDKPVAARGALFSFMAGPAPDTLCTEFESPRPQEVADAILQKIKGRIEDPHAPEGLSACQTS